MTLWLSSGRGSLLLSPLTALLLTSLDENSTSSLDQTMVHIRVSTCFKYDMMIYSIIGECNVTGSTNGRLQLVEMCNSDGVWSPICDNEWTQEDATVVCRELGYQG